MRYLYSALLYCLLPLTLVRLLWRSRRVPGYRRRLGERFGVYSREPPSGRPVIWVHAVSVGEVAASAPLVERLLAEYPQGAIVVTTTTPTGSDRVRAIFGERVTHVYCPWDLPGAVNRFLRWARPDVLLLVETELWPNLLYLARATGCRTALVNARLSSRSAARYTRLAGFSHWLVGQLDAIACRSEIDSERFLALGAPEDRVLVSGNLKWDAGLEPGVRARGEQLRAENAGRQVLLAASTHPGEEGQVIEAWQSVAQNCPGCGLVLVPRHPERAVDVAALCRAKGLNVVPLSDGPLGEVDFDVLLGDTLGDLPALYAIATVAFIGGSLVPVGGHNPVEASLWEVPVVSGPHIRNFEDTYGVLSAVGAVEVVENSSALGGAVRRLLDDPVRRADMAGAAMGVVRENRGALERVLALVAVLAARA